MNNVLLLVNFLLNSTSTLKQSKICDCTYANMQSKAHINLYLLSYTALLYINEI